MMPDAKVHPPASGVRLTTPALIGRLIFNAFFLLSSVYCVLAFHPFTYERVVKDQIIGWVTTFVRSYPIWYFLVQAVAALTLLRDLHTPRLRRRAAIYLLAALALGVLFTAHPVMSTLRNDRSSLLWAGVMLMPIFCLAILDHAAVGSTVTFAGGQIGEIPRIMRACLLSGLLVFGTFSLLFVFRFGARASDLPKHAVAVAWCGSLLLHMLPFCAGALALALVHNVARLFRRPARVEFFLAAALAAALVALVFRKLVFPAMAFAGIPATGSAIAFAAALITALTGIALGRQRARDNPIQNGIALLLRPLCLPPHQPRWLAALGFFALAAIAGLATYGAGIQDWNGLMQQLAALFSWALVFAGFMARPRRPGGEDGTLGLVLTAVLLLGAHRTFVMQRGQLPAVLKDSALDVALTLDRYAALEPSFRFLHEMLTPHNQEDKTFFEFLQRNTNIPQDKVIAPIDVRFTDDLRPSTTRPPNIFMVVVDSLRRDYLSPFNPRVTFTPAAGRFGAESFVFTNTFTRYGATGLSEPSIWVGGMMPHKQYISPFKPLNALEKLLIAEGYQRFISVDNILRFVLDQTPSPDSPIVRLDATVQVKDYDLCRSLAEAETKIDAHKDRARPMFLYTQAQNIHIATITRDGKTVPAGESYPGFYAPYAARLRRIDGCFGKFIDFLKERRIYDDSIVILTADHGDSLGEEGRWGHAYMVNPEIVRIPLIIHVPPRLRPRGTVDTSRVAFSTDITPTLYHLLGHLPIANAPAFGTSLLRPNKAGPDRKFALIASSYGPVYGILADKGLRLFVADAVNYTDTFFDLEKGLTGNRLSITPETRDTYYKHIRDAIADLHAVYHVKGID